MMKTELSLRLGPSIVITILSFTIVQAKFTNHTNKNER